MWGSHERANDHMINISKPSSFISCQSFKQAENSQKDLSVVPRFAVKQLFTKTKSKEIAARANNYLLMLIFNVRSILESYPMVKSHLGLIRWQ